MGKTCSLITCGSFQVAIQKGGKHVAFSRVPMVVGCVCWQFFKEQGIFCRALDAWRSTGAPGRCECEAKVNHNLEFRKQMAKPPLTFQQAKLLKFMNDGRLGLSISELRPNFSVVFVAVKLWGL